MKYLILSDIHGNLEALEEVLARHVDKQILVLGDIIGYGADPKACLERIRGLNVPTLMGNHERVQLDFSELSKFNALARESAEYTRSKLSESDLDWIRHLPVELFYQGFYLTHGSPYDPDSFRHLMPRETMSPHLHLSFSRMAELEIQIAFHGHTHFPGVFTESSGKKTYAVLEPGIPFELAPDKRYIINCGSVGQPRNHDCNAQFAVYDDETQTVTLESVPYDITRTAAKMQAVGLPKLLWQRLFVGI